MRYCGRPSGSRRSSEAGEASRQTAFLLARVLDRVFVVRAEITERSRAFTVSEDRKTDATSGSSTTATDPACIAPAKRFVRDRRYSNRYSRLVTFLALKSRTESRLVVKDTIRSRWSAEWPTMISRLSAAEWSGSTKILAGGIRKNRHGLFEGDFMLRQVRGRFGGTPFKGDAQFSGRLPRGLAPQGTWPRATSGASSGCS